MISIIIPSYKPEIVTLASLKSCPVQYEVFVSKGAGLGFCRNEGVRAAHASFVVMVDDDLVLEPEIWPYILRVLPGEFGMAFLSGFPCSRVFAIHTRDFWRLGGFDERIRFTGEDRDFYARALEAGLRFREIPLRFVHHMPHLPRSRNIHVGIGAVRENVAFIMHYWRRYPKVFKVDFLDRAKRGQARTLLLQFVFLLYFIVRGVD